MFLRAAHTTTGDTKIQVLGGAQGGSGTPGKRRSTRDGTPGTPRQAAGQAPACATGGDSVGGGSAGGSTATDPGAVGTRQQQLLQQQQAAAFAVNPNHLVVTALLLQVQATLERLLLRQCGIGAGAIARLRKDGLNSCSGLCVHPLMPGAHRRPR